jgi:oxygen-independent coproporphyrinogen-3 oxidase
MTETKSTRELELYLHIPFCIQKCKYCDFLSAPASRQVQKAYMEALVREVQETGCGLDCLVTSIFIGGGTPSVVDAQWTVRLMDAVRERYVLSDDAEISMEVNPGTVTEESLGVYRQAGINRLSIGCQSTRDAELARLGRIHNFRQFLDTYGQARRAGFTNINVDLMSALPGQTMADWEETLGQVLSLEPPPEHISAYSLIVEEGTDFYGMQEKGELDIPDEDTEREMYWRTAEILKEAGYEHYEISNYAQKGFACRHNCGYWQRRDYLGFGLGAASLYEGTRFKNTDSMETYMADSRNSRTEFQRLSQQDEMEETMFLGLRMAEGVDAAAFAAQFGRTPQEVYGEQIAKSVREGLLECGQGRIRLTGRGVDLSNYVMARFLLERE